MFRNGWNIMLIIRDDERGERRNVDGNVECLMSTCHKNMNLDVSFFFSGT
jgi:hypothetical protein